MGFKKVEEENDMLPEPQQSLFPVIVKYGIVIICGSLFLVLMALFSIRMAHEYKKAARLSKIKNNLKQIGLALHNYHERHRAVPSSVE